MKKDGENKLIRFDERRESAFRSFDELRDEVMAILDRLTTPQTFTMQKDLIDELNRIVLQCRLTLLKEELEAHSPKENAVPEKDT